MPSPSLVVIVGPNGSGKSSLIKVLADLPDIDLGTYINADDIELTLQALTDSQARSREGDHRRTADLIFP